MKATFLGHQGWLLETGAYRLLVDPILTPYFRNSPNTKMWIFPPRAIDVQALGSVNGVYFSHEHEDHFHIESIDLLSRTTAVFLSINMTGAAERILVEMGFAVERLPALSPRKLGDLTLTLFPPPPSPTEHWVLQPFIESEEPGVNFFNPVDCAISPEFVAHAKQSKTHIGLLSVANNSQILPHFSHPTQFMPARPSAAANAQPLRPLVSTTDALSDLPMVDQLAVIGGGFLDETNPYGMRHKQNMPEFAATIMEYSLGLVDIFGPDPGQVIEVGKKGSRDRLGRAAWVGSSADADAAVKQARSVKFKPDPFGYDYPPTTGRRSLTLDERRQLAGCLAELSKRIAVHSFTTEMLQHSLLDDGQPVGRGRLLLILLDDERQWIQEYDPTSAAFVDVSGPPTSTFRLAHSYPFGFECWASDMLALLQGHIPVYEMILFRCRAWRPDRHFVCRLGFPLVLNDLLAAEAWPELTYELYRSALARCGG